MATHLSRLFSPLKTLTPVPSIVGAQSFWRTRMIETGEFT